MDMFLIHNMAVVQKSIGCLGKVWEGPSKFALSPSYKSRSYNSANIPRRDYKYHASPLAKSTRGTQTRLYCGGGE